MSEERKFPPNGMTNKEWMDMLIKSREFQQWQQSGPDVIGSEAYLKWYRRKHGKEWNVHKEPQE